MPRSPKRSTRTSRAMPKPKKPKTQRLTPQSYQHRVELALMALKTANEGTTALLEFMLEQLGTEWDNQNARLQKAEEHFKTAILRVQHAQHEPGEYPDPQPEEERR